MSHKIGDKVIFIKRSYKEYAWELNDFDEFEITDKAFDKMGIDTYYGVKDKNGNYSSWYLETDFKTVKELRKLKLQKIKANYGN